MRKRNHGRVLDTDGPDNTLTVIGLVPAIIDRELSKCGPLTDECWFGNHGQFTGFICESCGSMHTKSFLCALCGTLERVYSLCRSIWSKARPPERRARRHGRHIGLCYSTGPLRATSARTAAREQNGKQAMSAAIASSVERSACYKTYGQHNGKCGPNHATVIEILALVCDAILRTVCT